jgi:hypothetical protein
MPFHFNPEAKPFRPEVGGKDLHPVATHKEHAASQLPTQKQEVMLVSDYGCSGDCVDPRAQNWPRAREQNGTPLRVLGGDEFPPLGAPCRAKSNKGSHRILPPRKSLLTEQLAALELRENSKDGLSKVRSLTVSVRAYATPRGETSVLTHCSPVPLDFGCYGTEAPLASRSCFQLLLQLGAVHCGVARYVSLSWDDLREQYAIIHGSYLNVSYYFVLILCPLCRPF